MVFACFSDAPEREAETIAALDLGADDFVNKPLGVGELMARLRTGLAPSAPAERPMNSQLDCSELERTFRMRMPLSVADCVQRIVKG